MKLVAAPAPAWGTGDGADAGIGADSTGLLAGNGSGWLRFFDTEANCCLACSIAAVVEASCSFNCAICWFLFPTMNSNTNTVMISNRAIQTLFFILFLAPRCSRVAVPMFAQRNVAEKLRSFRFSRPTARHAVTQWAECEP